MLVFDLDDTLLRNDKTISEYTISVLKKCRSRGIKVVYATGRGNALRVVPQELFDGYVRNGGAVAIADSTKVYEKLVSVEKAREFLLKCDSAGLKIGAQDEMKHYSNFNVNEIWSWITDYTIVDFTKLDIIVEKIYAMPERKQDLEIIEKNLPDWLTLITARDKLAMIMHREASKSKAVNVLAEYWKIETSEIMAFGDDLNDVDLLEYSGVGVAMGNALDEVKAVADNICDTNENDGAAKWIEEHVLYGN